MHNVFLNLFIQAIRNNLERHDTSVLLLTNYKKLQRCWFVQKTVIIAIDFYVACTCDPGF